jgi:hypothetical protein
MNIGEYCPSQYIILHSQAALDNIHAITFGILPGQDHPVAVHESVTDKQITY